MRRIKYNRRQTKGVSKFKPVKQSKEKVNRVVNINDSVSPRDGLKYNRRQTNGQI